MRLAAGSWQLAAESHVGGHAVWCVDHRILLEAGPDWRT